MDTLQIDLLHLLNKIFYQFQKHFAWLKKNIYTVAAVELLTFIEMIDEVKQCEKRILVLYVLSMTIVFLMCFLSRNECLNINICRCLVTS